MSKTSISPKTKLRVWVAAGGRCEYPGCNDLLWRDDLTLTEMNRAYLAHIVGDREGGPRGDPDLSEQLGDDPSNLMLLCDTHHRLIDREGKDDHPTDLLRRYKAEHEERIERQTAVHAQRKTHMLLFGTRVGDRSGPVCYDEAARAVGVEGRYPATPKGIRIDLRDCPVNVSDESYWVYVKGEVGKVMDRMLRPGEGPTGKQINHLSVFGLAPIPALIYLGHQLGDIGAVDVFQKQREPGGWAWQPFEDEGFNYTLTHPESAKQCNAVTIRLSLSGRVHESEVRQAIEDDLPDYHLTVASPSKTMLRSREHLELFRHEWSTLLSRIRESHGPSCVVHLFPAVPNSVAVEIGRSLLPKADPTLHVYDCDRALGGYHLRLTI